MYSFAIKKKSIVLILNETIVVLTMSAMIPFIVHLLPLPGKVPLGAIFLPLFYAPFVAVVLFRPSVSIISALAAPFLNQMLTGNPGFEKAIVLTLELLLFTLVAQTLWRQEKYFWGAAVLSYVVSKALSVLLLWKILLVIPGMPGVEYFLRSIRTALPGIGILFLMNMYLKGIKGR
ncbi:MAG: hypothetical protein WDL87_10690 [Candidatus Omnitrophota bacterium]|jgi:hypothetical protein